MQVVFQLVLFTLFTLGSGIANSIIASDEEIRIVFIKRCEPTSRIPDITEPTSREALKKAIFEEIKSLVLMAMNLTEPRTISRSLFFLQSFDANSSSWDNRARIFSDDYSGYESWNNHVVRSEIVPDSCHSQNGQQCLRFRIPLPEFLSNSSKYVAELWLYKKENVTDYTITQIIEDPLLGTIQEIFYVSNQTEREFWTKLDVTYLIDKLATDVLDFRILKHFGPGGRVDGKKRKVFPVRDFYSSGLECDRDLALGGYCVNVSKGFYLNNAVISHRML
ncbi:inhibin beta E chain [Trichonephila inaurata madagascariensis]|uniref:Inhibin beta E chain n=1 Tax=Trichonephila inaurata madagascariensis TaxID=2747483 RepID=A0A8X6MKW6_9ARAC|nr:inhibin beta E chain [Trichonephila inaurata madagascariensis]